MMKQTNSPAIYAIRHIESGKVYVGSAVRVLSRFSQHKSLLNKGKHHNRYLQAAWVKYGQDAFEFAVLEQVASKEELILREDAHIQSKDATNPSKGYNLRKEAGSQLGMRHSDEARQKMSASRKGHKKTAEHQAAINASLTGRKLSNEHKAKIAAKRTNSKASEETREKMRIAHAATELSPEAHKRMITANVGRKFSKEHRQRIAEANKRRVVSDETKAKISAARRLQIAKKKAIQEQAVASYGL